jgi:hypothetical protein
MINGTMRYLPPVDSRTAKNKTQSCLQTTYAVEGFIQVHPGYIGLFLSHTLLAKKKEFFRQPCIKMLPDCCPVSLRVMIWRSFVATAYEKKQNSEFNKFWFEKYVEKNSCKYLVIRK